MAYKVFKSLTGLCCFPWILIIIRCIFFLPFKSRSSAKHRSIVLMVFHEMPYFLQHFAKNLVKTLKHGTFALKMWSSQLWLRFKQSQGKPGKCFRGFNGIRTHGLCISATVLHQLSYEDPYVGSGPIGEDWNGLHLGKFEKRRPTFFQIYISLYQNVI